MLRHAGLIFNHRDRARTLHHLTDLGRALLEANAQECNGAAGTDPGPEWADVEKRR